MRNWVKKEKGLRSTDQQLQHSHGDVNCGIGRTVNNGEIPKYGARQAVVSAADHFVSYTHV